MNQLDPFMAPNHLMTRENADLRRPECQPITDRVAAMNLIRSLVMLFVASLSPFGQFAYGAESAAPGFVYVANVDGSIRQDIRYAGSHNFVGRPIAGYNAAECLLTDKAAQALVKVQAELATRMLSLVVWDCYRPARAVADFLRWSKMPSDIAMKTEFYPRTDKAKLFALGYLATRSAHSRGSAVDLGIVPASISSIPAYVPGSRLIPCIEAKGDRFEDGTIDFGTGYDCLDVLAGTSHPAVSKPAFENRQMLKGVMGRFGFKPYSKEWWHFELIDEPFPQQRLDFPIGQRPTR